MPRFHVLFFLFYLSSSLPVLLSRSRSNAHAQATDLACQPIKTSSSQFPSPPVLRGPQRPSPIAQGQPRERPHATDGGAASKAPPATRIGATKDARAPLACSSSSSSSPSSSSSFLTARVSERRFLVSPIRRFTRRRSSGRGSSEHSLSRQCRTRQPGERQGTSGGKQCPTEGWPW